jgi:hypothetical protein
MKKKIFLAFSLMLVNCLFGQEYSIKISENIIDSVSFKTEFIDKVYQKNSKIEIKYKITNNSEKTIIAFNPGRINHLQIIDFKSQDNCCEYQINLGGAWFFKPGFKSYLDLIEIPSKEKYETIISYKFGLSEENCNCKIGFDKYIDNENVRSILLYFNVAYEPKISTINFTKKNLDGYFDFETDEDGLSFDINLRRMKIGPLLIKRIE